MQDRNIFVPPSPFGGHGRLLEYIAVVLIRVLLAILTIESHRLGLISNLVSDWIIVVSMFEVADCEWSRQIKLHEHEPPVPSWLSSGAWYRMLV